MPNILKVSIALFFFLSSNQTFAQTEDSLNVNDGIYNEKVTIYEEGSSDEDNKQNKQAKNPDSESGERVRVYSGKQDGMNVIYDSHKAYTEPKPKEKIRIYSGGQDGNNIIFDPKK